MKRCRAGLVRQPTCRSRAGLRVLKSRMEDQEMRKQIRIPFVSVGFCLSIALGFGNAPAASAQDVTSDPSCQVTIDSGAVEGVLVGQTCKNLGIPYAAPPAGDLLWRPPAPVAPWLGVLTPATFATIPPQIRAPPALPTQHSLTLNAS